MNLADKSLQEYFMFLTKHVVHSSELRNKAKNLLHALENQAEQLELLLNAPELSTPPELGAALILKIKVELEWELSLLKEIIWENRLRTKELRSHLHDLLKVCYNELPPNFVEGSYVQPSQSKLLEWAEYSWRYYHSICLQMNHSLQNLDYEKVNSIPSLSQSFSVDTEKEDYIQFILASYFSGTQLKS